VITVAGPDRVIQIHNASLVAADGICRAWAERHVRTDPFVRWIVGNYVEADHPNSNGHIFPLKDLQEAYPSLIGKPLNMMHRQHYIVGAFAGAALVDEDGNDVGAVAASEASVTMEAVAGFWHKLFNEELYSIERAHADGNLYFSMESVPSEVSCPSCETVAPYGGSQSESYCEHMNAAGSPMRLHDPTFCGGAIIIPPVKPGWKRADVTAISRYVSEQTDHLRDQVEQESPHLGPSKWDRAMTEIMELARTFNTEERNRMSNSGTAMPDGSFPIKSRQDVQNAIRAIGRAKDPAAARRHIKKRARALGCSDLIPSDW
jgi:hypothetical protein